MLSIQFVHLLLGMDVDPVAGILAALLAKPSRLVRARSSRQSAQDCRTG